MHYKGYGLILNNLSDLYDLIGKLKCQFQGYSNVIKKRSRLPYL